MHRTMAYCFTRNELNFNYYKRMKKNVVFVVMLFFMFIGCTLHKEQRNEQQKEKNNQLKDSLITPPLEQSDSIRKYSKRLKRFYKEVDPSEKVDVWYLPFELSERNNLKMIQIISGYGDYRSGRAKGHKHSGIDIIPINQKEGAYVYPAAKGIVCYINPIAPNKTISIKHILKDGFIIFTAYTHLNDIYIEVGQEVNANTRIGKLYTRSEALKFKGNYDHLHFEVRKRYDDHGCASWLSMSIEELNQYFYEPFKFLKSHLNK